MDFLSYLNAVRKHWWPLMSCAFFTVLGMWVFYADKSNAWALKATFSIAGFCLFWAGYRAWLEEHKAGDALSKPSVRDRALELSQSILDFYFDRRKDAPSVPVWTFQPYGSDTTAFWAESQKSTQQHMAVEAYERETLEIYRYKYSRTVVEVVSSLKNAGTNTAAIDNCIQDLVGEANPQIEGIRIPANISIKMVGEQLAILADQTKTVDRQQLL